MKKILIVVGAIIVVLILIVVIAPLFISADALKGQILARVHDATGRDLQIGGPLSVGFFPNVKVEATQVSLANAPDAQSPTMAKLKRLDLVVRLIPLLSGRVEVERLVLVDPSIDLEIDPQGRPSWSFAESGAALPAATPGGVPPKNPSMMGLAALSRLQVKDVSIENGDIVLLDRRTNQHYELQQVALTVSAPNLNSPATIDGSAMWRGQQVTISVKLDSAGALMQAGGKTNVAASVTAQPVTLKVTGSVANDNAALAFDGNVELAAPSVRDLVAWLGLGIALPKHGFGALAVSGAVHAENGVAKFANGNFALDTIKATGALSLDATGAKPSLTGALATGMLDFNPYLAPPVPGWSADTFDTAMLRQVDADLSVDAQGVKFRKLQIGKSAGTVHLKDGKLALNVSDVSMYRGDAKGTVNLDATGQVAAVTLNGTVSGVDIGALLRDAGGGGGIGGSGTFTLSGTARGNSERALISTLSGRASFRSRERLARRRRSRRDAEEQHRVVHERWRRHHRRARQRQLHHPERRHEQQRSRGQHRFDGRDRQGHGQPTVAHARLPHRAEADRRHRHRAGDRQRSVGPYQLRARRRRHRQGHYRRAGESDRRRRRRRRQDRTRPRRGRRRRAQGPVRELTQVPIEFCRPRENRDSGQPHVVCPGFPLSRE